MAEILVMENSAMYNQEQDRYHGDDHEDDDDEEYDTGYSDFSIMIPHISDSNSRMNPVWQVNNEIFLRSFHVVLITRLCHVMDPTSPPSSGLITSSSTPTLLLSP